MGNRRNYYGENSNPAREIKINQEKIGGNIEASDRYVEQLQKNYGANYAAELYVEEDFDNNFKLIYQFTPDYDSPDQHKLKIYYGPTSKLDKKLDFLFNEEGAAANPDVDELTIENFKNKEEKIRIKEFQNGDYGIDLPPVKIDELSGGKVVK